MLDFLKDFIKESDLIYCADIFKETVCQEVSLECIEKLQKIVKQQKFLLEKLCDSIKLLKKTKITCDMATQTGESSSQPSTWKDSYNSVEEMVKEAAEDAMKQTGFVYESTSGMYYDYSTGYYYNAELGLYYDGNSGIYYYYDETKKAFEFHSQVGTPIPEKSSSKLYKRKKKKNKPDSKINKKVKSKSDAEEGECSEESSESDAGQSEETAIQETSAIQIKYDTAEISKAWPPCMRIVVKETKVKGLKVGTLFLLTYEGGTLGREGNHLVLIPDLNISKYHAKFSFDTKNEEKEIGNYTLTDLGSRNGTFVDGKRLSTALQESEPYPIPHESVIRVGGTTLICHVHPGRETCSDCEPGLLITSADDQRAYASEQNMSEKRKNELKKLKKKFGFKNTGENSPVTNTEYKDRAKIRRQTVGSHNSCFKPEVACVTQPIKKTNKGFKMLAKMGWSEGESLGTKTDGGITDPILVQQRADKVGLGYDKPVELELDPADKRKLDVWKKAQKRYQNLE